MRNILTIFKRDLHGLFTNFFALVVAGGLLLLPALYAWFNIYANWDPYGNTGNLQIAVANMDEGWVNDDGEFLNMGEDLVEELSHKDSIGWVFLDSDEEAVDGVNTGKYYASLVVEKDFTYSMYHGIMDNIENPHITYYVNGKKNAIATKITDTAVGTVQQSINKQFIKAVTEQVFEEANVAAEELEEEDAVTEFIGKLEKVNDDLGRYETMIDEFVAGNEHVENITNDANKNLNSSQKKVNEGTIKIADAKKSLAQNQADFNQYSKDIDTAMSSMGTRLNNINEILKKYDFEKDAKAIAEDMVAIQNDCTDMIGDLEAMAGGVDPVTKAQIEAIVKLLNSVSESIGDMTPELSEKLAGIAMEEAKNAVDSYAKTLAQLKDMYDNQLVPQVNAMLDSMQDTLSATSDILVSLSKTMTSANQILTGLNKTIDAANMTMLELQTVVVKTHEQLTEVLDELHAANVEQQTQIIINLLSGDPETLGEFFSEPVQVSENYIYSIKNYGSGVAPFYTTLAIWVGMTILVSLLKVHAPKAGLVDPKPWELFLGRYLIFFFMSQIQALIIALGNIFIFKIQCLYPLEFCIAACFTSLTFSLLVYSLTIAFGDIGKALAVVVMVIQIAGSGGTYPIEALPSFFRAVYIFFPFPYAIDAMRECIGGMYQNRYSLCLLQLGLFCVAALVIGLVIRIPFIGVNHFIEERMEDTEML